jgi:hypothetical protein
MEKFNQIPQGIRGIQQKVKFYIPSGSEETQLSDDLTLSIGALITDLRVTQKLTFEWKIVIKESQSI